MQSTTKRTTKTCFIDEIQHLAYLIDVAAKGDFCLEEDDYAAASPDLRRALRLMRQAAAALQGMDPCFDAHVANKTPINER